MPLGPRSLAWGAIVSPRPSSSTLPFAHSGRASGARHFGEPGSRGKNKIACHHRAIEHSRTTHGAPPPSRRSNAQFKRLSARDRCPGTRAPGGGSRQPTVRTGFNLPQGDRAR